MIQCNDLYVLYTYIIYTCIHYFRVTELAVKTGRIPQTIATQGVQTVRSSDCFGVGLGSQQSQGTKGSLWEEEQSVGRKSGQWATRALSGQREQSCGQKERSMGRKSTQWADSCTCDGHNLALLLQQLDQVELVGWRASGQYLHMKKKINFTCFKLHMCQCNRRRGSHNT